jgi:hypothetical protein
LRQAGKAPMPEFRVMKFRELVSAGVLSAFLVPAQTAGPAAVEIAREPHRHWLLENGAVRVFLGKHCSS